jgi:hypothetical protein
MLAQHILRITLFSKNEYYNYSTTQKEITTLTSLFICFHN